MWLAVVLLALVSAGVGYVSFVVYKHKQLIQEIQNAKSARADCPRPTTATPDRRGMGAQSDFISETFVPTETHRVHQLRMARTLIAIGSDPLEVTARLGLSLDLLDGEVASGSTTPKLSE